MTAETCSSKTVRLFFLPLKDVRTSIQGTTLPADPPRPRRLRPKRAVEQKARHRSRVVRRRMERVCPRRRKRCYVRRNNHLGRHCFWVILVSRRRRRRFGSCLRRIGIGGARAGRRRRGQRNRRWTGVRARARTDQRNRKTCGYERSVWARLKTVVLVKGLYLTSSSSRDALLRCVCDVV